MIVRPGTEREKVTGAVYEHMQPDEVLVNCSGGGGGWGDPVRRDPEAVLEDVRMEYVSPEAARSEYRVAIDLERMEVDEAATKALREGDSGNGTL